MKAQKLAWVAPLLLVSVNSFAQGDDRAVPRGGGSSASSDAGSRHTSSSSGSSASSPSERGSSAGASGGGFESSSAPDAARRHPRPGTGTGDRYYRGGSSYRSAPYSNYYYDPYRYGYGWGSPYRYGYYGYGYGYYDYGYGYGDYSGYYPSYGYRTYRYRDGNFAQVRTLVEPAKTRVYVDGYYAGIADDFDGIFQRLNVSPGRHEIALKLEGYQSHIFTVYSNRDQTLKLRWDMAKGTGETKDTIGAESERYEREFDQNADRDDRRTPPRADRPYVPPARDRDPNRDRDADRDRGGERGQLSIDVQPGDASVYIDGEFFGKASELSRLDLPIGPHHVEAVRPGYKTEEVDVEIGRDGKRVSFRLERR